MTEILCKDCNCRCDRYDDYDTIGCCNECGRILTSKKGDEVEIHKVEN